VGSIERYFDRFTYGGGFIRYDHRGTGMSDWVEDWDRKDPYSVADMAGDAVAVLDALAIQEAHVALGYDGLNIRQETCRNHTRRRGLVAGRSGPHFPGAEHGRVNKKYHLTLG
jgi:hypothetical protein